MAVSGAGRGLGRGETGAREDASGLSGVSGCREKGSMHAILEHGGMLGDPGLLCNGAPRC